MKKQNLAEIISLTFGVLVLIFTVGFYSYAAWTEPSSAPPNGNISPPINTSTNVQAKLGPLIISGLALEAYNNAYFSTVGGKVGIGTSTPTHLLDVAGNVGLKAGSYVNFGYTDGTDGYGIRDSVGVLQYKNSGGSWANIDSGGGGGTPGGGIGAVQFNSAGVFAGDEANFFWDNTNKRLGIGTSTIATRLDIIQGAVVPYAGVKIGHTGTAKAMFLGRVSTGSYYSYIGDSYYYSSGNWRTPVTVGSALRFKDSGGISFFADSGLTANTNYVPTERLTITADGKVGVGDSTPDHLFDVLGNIGLTAGSYINYGDTDGDLGYGFRDNAGVVQYKNSGGSWANIGSGSNISGDINFPEGFNGVVPVRFPLGDNESYTVTAGKTLYITTAYNSAASDNSIRINGNPFWGIAASSNMTFPSALVAPAGSVLTSYSDNVRITGIEVDANSAITIVNQYVDQATGYTIPSGKTLYIKTAYSSCSSENAISDGSWRYWTFPAPWASNSFASSLAFPGGVRLNSPVSGCYFRITGYLK